MVGIDLPTYLKNLAASDETCHYVVADIEELSHRLERERGFIRYRWPILAGVGAGATLAYAALAQAPAATVAGAVAIDPSPALATRVPLCPGAPATPAAARRLLLRPAQRSPRMVAGLGAAPAPSTACPALRSVVETAAPGAAVADRLVAQVGAALGADDAADADQSSDLAVVEYPSESGSDVLAIIYSGDGGWRDLDKEIGETLAARGLPVVGVDSLRSFWSPKSPEEMAHDLGDLIQTYDERWGTRRVVLIGYSFGAGVLPFAVNLLPDAERDAHRADRAARRRAARRLRDPLHRMAREAAGRERSPRSCRSS